MRYFLGMLIVLLWQTCELSGKEAVPATKVRNPFYLESELAKQGGKTTSNRQLVDVSKMSLSGIFVSDSDKIALINNEILREGESIDNKKIVSIKDDRVLVEEDDMSATLLLPKIVEGIDDDTEK